MAIKEETIWIGFNSTSIEYWENKGYEIQRTKNVNGKMVVKRGYKIEVSVEDLSEFSHEKLTKICDMCENECKTKQTYYDILTQRSKGDGLDRCVSCGNIKSAQTLLCNVPFIKSITYKAPHIKEEWHTVLNGIKTPDNVSYGSNILYWWVCPECGEKYNTSPKSRVCLSSNCPYCSGKKACLYNCLATTHPELSKLWHPTKNGILTPYDVTHGSAKRVWWVCKIHESYESYVHEKSTNRGCPKCRYISISGENHWNYKSELSEEERNLSRNIIGYTDWRNSVYKRDDYTCQCCGKRGGDIHVHHKDSYNWCVERRIDINNGVTLCEECHSDFHFIYGFGDNTEEQYDEWISELLIESESKRNENIDIAI